MKILFGGTTNGDDQVTRENITNYQIHNKGVYSESRRMCVTQAPLFQIMVLDHERAETRDHAVSDANNEDITQRVNVRENDLHLSVRRERKDDTDKLSGGVGNFRSKIWGVNVERIIELVSEGCSGNATLQ